MQPEVSVIMTAYNTEAYIAKAIETVLAQSFKNIELVVVDNGSVDRTREIIQSFQAKDKRVNLVVNQKNLGVSGGFNTALRAAKGKWVAIVDSDDWIEPQRFARLLHIASAENADMIADDLYLIRDGEASPWSTLICQSGESITQVTHIDPVYFVATDIYRKQCLHLGLTKPLIKREFLLQHGLEFNNNISVIVDFCLYLESLLKGARYILVPEPYYYYRSRSSSMVASYDKVKNLQQCSDITSQFLKREEVKNNPQLKQALLRNLGVLQRNLAYERVVQPLKHKKWLTGVQQMVKNPYFFWHFLLEIPSIVERRIQYYILGNTTVYDMLPRKNKSLAS